MGTVASKTKVNRNRHYSPAPRNCAIRVAFDRWPSMAPRAKTSAQSIFCLNDLFHPCQNKIGVGALKVEVTPKHPFMNKRNILALAVVVSSALVWHAVCQNSNPTHNACQEAPEGIPSWIQWDCNKQRAFEAGRMHFSKDSTLVMFPAEYNPFDTSKLVSVRLSPEFEEARRRKHSTSNPR